MKQYTFMLHSTDMLLVLLLFVSMAVALSSDPDGDDRVIDLQELLLNVSKSYTDFGKGIKNLRSDISETINENLNLVVETVIENSKRQNENLKLIVKNIDTSSKDSDEKFKQVLENLNTNAKEVAGNANSMNNFLEKILTALNKIDDSANLRVEAKPRDCADILVSGKVLDGIYRIWPDQWELSGSFEVLCDMTTDGGGWTVFQKRGNFGLPQDYFFKTWNEYKNGFGELTKEFWLGNDRLFALTNQREYQLRVNLWDMENQTSFAKYDKFWIENEAQLYRLNTGGFEGPAGDSLAWQNTMRFTAKDRDNDLYVEGNCADLYKGGWWYNTCHGSNLNGLNLNGPHKSYADGIEWSSWKGAYYSLYSQMKIRPLKFVKTT